MRSIFFLFLAFALICVIVADGDAQGDHRVRRDDPMKEHREERDDKAHGGQRVRRDDDREKRSMPKDPQGDQRGRRGDEREKREGYGYNFGR